MIKAASILLLIAILEQGHSFSLQPSHVTTSLLHSKTKSLSSSVLYSENRSEGESDKLLETFGGYTAKQRLREEVESPFRKVRLLFFLSTVGSALTALYFSAISTLKAYMNYPIPIDGPPPPTLDESLFNSGINLAGAVVCGVLAYREYLAGQVNLERISKGSALAKLSVNAFNVEEGKTELRTLSEYRRNSRVLICAGGSAYIEELCRSLNADQLDDENNLADMLSQVDVMVVPVLLDGKKEESLLSSSFSCSVLDTQVCWRNTEPVQDRDRNFDSKRSDKVISFPRGYGAWADYLKSDVETANTQGFDVLSKGITLTVKKNGKILRRATGLPNWSDLIGSMEVLDGSQFGMPGDSEKYGGP